MGKSLAGWPFDNQNWRIVQTIPTYDKSVLFVVKQPPAASGPYYRAIILTG